jgi:flagellar biogenesis protein FliO
MDMTTTVRIVAAILFVVILAVLIVRLKKQRKG